MASRLFHRQILEKALEYGDEVALTDGACGKSLTFADVRRQSFALAKYLKEKHGVGKGDIVLCFMPNSLHYPIIFLAAALLGATQTGVNPDFGSTELANVIKRVKCKCIFAEAEFLPAVVDAVQGQKNVIPLYVFHKLGKHDGVSFEELMDELPIKPTDEEVDIEADAELTEDDILLTPLSSGTTGSPKCVMLTHRNFNVQTEILKETIFDKIAERSGRGRSTIAVLPFYHASGFWALCYCLLSGNRTIVMERFQAPLMLSCIEDYKIDTLNVVPSIVTFLLKNDRFIQEFDLSSVRIVLCGSAPISKEQVQTFLSRYPHVTNFVHGYGLTEIVALSHLSPLDLPLDDEKHITSCGKLLPRFECKVVCPDTGELIEQPGERGELWLRSEYLGEPEITAECIDADGFFHTGDLVSFDADGFFFVIERLKNVIKVNGLQVSPVELENLLLAHDHVLEAAVIGVPMEGFGEVPRAFVVLRNCEDEFEAVSQLRAFIHANVAPHKQLRGGIKLLPKLPRTQAGKVLREELRRMKSAELPGEDVVTAVAGLRVDVDRNNNESDGIAEEKEVRIFRDHERSSGEEEEDEAETFL
ncbi:4-coumarate--CoA ligase 2 [Aphelenchoides fujianensis]|nr:4-coumarate--CoA ligase 2 [Aphelenchoides fujianensis]